MAWNVLIQRAMAINGTGSLPSQVSLKTVFTVCFGATCAAALIVFGLKTKWSMTLALGAAMVAVALDHAVAVLERRGLRRKWAVLAVLLALLAVSALLAGVLLLPAISQARSLWLQAPELWQKLQKTELFLTLDAHLDLNEQLRRSTSVAFGLNALGEVLGVGSALVTVLLLAIFMLLFGRDLLDVLFAEADPANKPRYLRISSKVYGSVGGYVGGVLGICSINATVTILFLAITGMPFFLPLGLLSGLSSAVPYVGPMVSGTLITVLAFVTGGTVHGVITGVYFLCYGQVEGSVLGPIIFKHAAHVNPLVTTLAILFMAEFMGLPGAIIAVPAAATVQILARELLKLRKEQETMA